jgi:quercetin dioxygenase-like cupin family protein
MAYIEHLTTPPGKSSQPYVLPCYTGELWTIPTSNSTMRLLVTGKETNNAFTVVGTGGTFDKPIGFHFHREAHDVFLCLQGKLNVWANDKARSLSPGDFASVPPVCNIPYPVNAIHPISFGLFQLLDYIYSPLDISSCVSAVEELVRTSGHSFLV